jgi:hypothetical protein
MRFDKTTVGLGSLVAALAVLAPHGAEAAPAPDSGKPEASAPAAVSTGSPVGAPLTTAAPPIDGPTYTVRLRDLAERIDELKEKLRRHRTKLALLSDSILESGGGEARIAVRFASELTSTFRVSRVLVLLDGAVLLSRVDPAGAGSDPLEIPIFNGFVTPGDHTVQVVVNLQGDGHGVFPYMNAYRFEVRSSHSFTAIEGKTIKLDLVPYEKGTVTTPFEERPALRYGEKVADGVADPWAPAGSARGR